MKPTNFRCEYLVDPFGIDVLRPRLSWFIQSRRRGDHQTAYQIIVTSDDGELWDTGKVASDQSVLVPYAGRPLRSRMRCRWNVRVWDRDDQPSQWSEPALWTMGLLDPSDWQAQWIGARAELDPAEFISPEIRKRDAETESRISQTVPSPLLRKEFGIEKPVKHATAHICGLGFHDLHINGKLVSDDVLQPDFTHYDKRVIYITRDVTEHVRQGANAIGVELGNGFYNAHTRCCWSFDQAPWRKPPRLLMQLEIQYADGTTETIVTDATWKTSTGPRVFDGIRNGEVYDARLEKTGWDTAGYSDSDWSNVVLVDGPKGKLEARRTLAVRMTKTVKPVAITEPRPGVFLVDFGQNLAGWGRLKVSGPTGTAISIRYDERLTDEGLIDERNAIFVYSGKFQTDTYICKGEAVETWEPRFVYHGFRYAQITGFPGRPSRESLTACVVSTDFESRGSFECSNDLFNDIQRCTRWSYLSNFVGIPTDCPHREKNGWTGDAHLAAETGLYNFGSEASYTKWMDDFEDVQHDDGLLPGIVPTDTAGYGWGNGPAWDSAFLLIPYYMWLYRGDSRLLMAHYERFKLYLECVAAHSVDDIVEWGLGDWCPPEGGAEGFKTPYALTSTAYYFVDTLIVSQVAAMLEKTDEAIYYAELAEAIRKAFIARFYNPKTGKFEGEEQTGMAAAIYQGLVDGDDKAKVLAALVADVEARDGHLWCGILGTKYILHALTDNGRADVAYRIANQRTFPSWGHWLEQGATTLWEDWRGENSLNHIMFGDISAWFFQTLAGINPDPALPGFKHIIIRPQPVGDLTWARAEHVSPYGLIKSGWKLTDDVLRLDVEIPANATAAVYLPTQSPDSVAESEVPASGSDGVEFAGVQDGRAVYRVGSGSYSFKC